MSNEEELRRRADVMDQLGDLSKEKTMERRTWLRDDRASVRNDEPEKESEVRKPWWRRMLGL